MNGNKWGLAEGKSYDAIYVRYVWREMHCDAIKRRA